MGFVVLAALLIDRGSGAESKDSDDRMEKKVDYIAKRLDELDKAKVS